MDRVSNRKIDKIGERLKAGELLTDGEEAQLEGFLVSIDDAMTEVVETLRAIRGP